MYSVVSLLIASFSGNMLYSVTLFVVTYNYVIKTFIIVAFLIPVIRNNNVISALPCCVFSYDVVLYLGFSCLSPFCTVVLRLLNERYFEWRFSCGILKACFSGNLFNC